jgi:hypothetical protein
MAITNPRSRKSIHNAEDTLQRSRTGAETAVRRGQESLMAMRIFEETPGRALTNGRPTVFLIVSSALSPT